MNKDFGFSTAPILFIIFSLCVMIISIAAVVNSQNRKLFSYKKMAERKIRAEIILEKIIEDFQSLKVEKCDNDKNLILNSILDTYKENNFVIKDVSTGINKKFWNEKILENKEIKKLYDFYRDDVFVDYAWCNKNVAGEIFVKNLQNEFNENDITKLFPLINTLPVLNIYYMNRDFILAILKLCLVSNAEEKANKLYEKCLSENIDKKEIVNILEVSESNIVMNYLGCKTTFWKITFETNFFCVKAIIAAVPYRKEKIGEIEKYILIEKEILKKGEENAK